MPSSVQAGQATSCGRGGAVEEAPDVSVLLRTIADFPVGVPVAS
jgi:hypothetical protein